MQNTNFKKVFGYYLNNVSGIFFFFKNLKSEKHCVKQ